MREFNLLYKTSVFNSKSRSYATNISCSVLNRARLSSRDVDAACHILYLTLNNAFEEFVPKYSMVKGDSRYPP